MQVQGGVALGGDTQVHRTDASVAEINVLEVDVAVFDGGNRLSEACVLAVFFGDSRLAG